MLHRLHRLNAEFDPIDQSKNSIDMPPATPKFYIIRMAPELRWPEVDYAALPTQLSLGWIDSHEE
ncbi:hypothetical protein ACFWVM_31235 [Nocardia fluminea]|uniref:hypothetical protein n=1 Tax=Nocardia fluminea TaxID=134984 RepID=UPI003655BA34